MKKSYNGFPMIINTFTRNPSKGKLSKELCLPSIQNDNNNQEPLLSSKSSKRNHFVLFSQHNKSQFKIANANNKIGKKNIVNRINSTISMISKPKHQESSSFISHSKKPSYNPPSNQISNENVFNMNCQSSTNLRNNPHKRIIKSTSNFLKVLNQPPHNNISTTTDSKANSIPLPKIRRKHYEISKAGRSMTKPSKVNQDNYLMAIDLFNLFHCDIFGVLDGHGCDGHLVSLFIKTKFLKDFCSKQSYNTGVLKSINRDVIYQHITMNNYEMITSFYVNAEKELFANNKINTQNSGSTCVIVFCIGNKLICSNTGDSRAILVSRMPNGNYKYEPLSIDHKPMETNERNRIEQSGGIIAQIIEENDGPYRIFCKGETYPGIAVSRSIGDEIATEIGVISTSEIIERDITSDMCYIIVGSDGLWEHLDPDFIIKTAIMFYINNDAKGLCSILISEANERWSKKNETIDDITCLVYFINKYNPSKQN